MSEAMDVRIESGQGLREFVDVKRVQATLANDLSRLRGYCERLGLTASLPHIDDAIEHLQNDSFTIAVVGEFKRGKSTFINALLGKSILPTDILPTTATPNRITYGLQPSATIRFNDGRETDVPVDRLDEYVTKLTEESRRMASTVQEAVVRYPVPYLRNNVEIIDTPGLNDEASMTAVTGAVVPSVDVAILVIVPQSPFSQFEAEFLEHKLLTSDLAKVVFVVNRIDSLDGADEVDRMIDHVRSRVQGNVLERARQLYGQDSDEFLSYARKIGVPKVFGVSSRAALKAKLTNDAAALSESRFADFESALERFLTEERGPILLQVPLNRVRASSTAVLDATSLRQTSLEMERDEFLTVYESSIRDLADVRRRKTEELKGIDAAAGTVAAKVRPLIDQLPTDLMAGIDEAVDRAPVEPEDLRGNERIAATNARLGGLVADSMKDLTRLFAEHIELEIKKGLQEEAERLRDFSHGVDEVLGGITAQFDTIEADTSHQRKGAVEGAIAVAAIATGFAGMWSGYRQAGWKGAALGTGTSIGVLAGAGFLLGALAIPVTLPIVAVLGIVSFLTGGGAVRRFMGGQMVKNFRENYKKELRTQILNQLADQKIEEKVDAHISEAFEAFRDRLDSEVEAVLENTHSTLADLRAKRERNETLTEHQRKELTEIREDVQRIQGNAQRLAQQIVPVESV